MILPTAKWIDIEKWWRYIITITKLELLIMNNLFNTNNTNKRKQKEKYSIEHSKEN